MFPSREKAYMKEYARKRNKRLTDKGLCIKCGKRPKLENDLRCVVCHDRILAYDTKWRKQLKKDIYDHYGRICACCGESDPRFLSLDHINNDGNKHRREFGMSVWTLYAWIRNNNFPDSIQVLCYSCNCGKAHNHGICPHKDPLPQERQCESKSSASLT